MSQRIGIVTGGGDCPGLNAVIRAVVKAASKRGWESYGFLGGYEGMLEPTKYRDLTHEDLSSLLTRGGTILGTANRGKFSAKVGHGQSQRLPQELIDGVKESMRKWNLCGLVSIGGDGSLTIAQQLYEGGVAVVGVPKTIDNDLEGTVFTFGFDSAVSCATDALDRLHTTAESHNRVMVLEVMGRDAGHIALTAGVAGGADVILIPEIPWGLEAVCAKVEERRRAGRNFSLIVVAESVRAPSGEAMRYKDAHGQSRYGGIGREIAEAVALRTGAESRVTVLGHVQRGGSPVPYDRVLGSAFGVAAVDLAAEGRFDRVVGWRGRKVIDVPIPEACAAFQAVHPDDPLVHTARGLGISFGDGEGAA